MAWIYSLIWLKNNHICKSEKYLDSKSLCVKMDIGPKILLYVYPAHMVQVIPGISGCKQAVKFTDNKV